MTTEQLRPLTPSTHRTTWRRTGACFVTAFLVFVAMVPFVFLSPMNTEVFAEQARRGVGVDGLPIDVYAEIARRHQLDTLPLLIGTLLGMALFSVAAILASRHIAVRPWVRRLVAVGGIGVSVGWVAAAVVDLVMAYTSGWVRENYYGIYARVQTVVSGLACLTLVAIGLELRHLQVLPRFGSALALLAAAGGVLAAVVGVPPVLGLLLGAILGTLLIRRGGATVAVGSPETA